MNSLSKNIPVGSIVRTKDDGREYVCLSGFGMMNFTSGSAIAAYPKGRRRWINIKVTHYIYSYDDIYVKVNKKIHDEKVLATIIIRGTNIKKLVRKGWRKK